MKEDKMKFMSLKRCYENEEGEITVNYLTTILPSDG